MGVGDENFTRMLQMDSRTKPLEDKDGNKSERDMCQFVRYNDFKDRPDKLTEYMLTVIPSQVEAYYRASKNFVGLKDAGNPKNAYLRKLKEKKEKEQYKRQQTKSTFRKNSDEKYNNIKDKEKYEEEYVNTNA